MLGGLEMLLNFKLNKKGDISVAVMVILTLVLFVYVLGAMNSDLAKISGNFNDVSDITDFYARQQAVETTLYFRLVEVSLNSYVETLNENSMNIENDSNLDLNSIFRTKVESKFKNVEVEAPEEMKKLFENVDSVGFDGKNINVVVSNIRVEENLSYDQSSGSKIYYSPVFNSSFSMNKVGLPSFNEIRSVLLECRKYSATDAINLCFDSKLLAFKSSAKCYSTSDLFQIPNNLQVVEMPNQNLFSGKKCEIELKSRDSYYISKSMSQINFKLFFSYSSSAGS